jgi:multiple sugar transport system substrate-binding protein
VNRESVKITRKATIGIVLAFGLLSGCQGDRVPLVPIDQDSVAEPAHGPCGASDPGPVTITMSTHATDASSGGTGSGGAGSGGVNRLAVYRSLIDRFNATVGRQQGITVRLTDYSEANYEHALGSAIDEGHVPDVVEVDAPFVANFAYRQLIRPLGNCVSPQKLSTFIPSVVANGRYHRQQYTLGAYDSGMGLWVNRAALQKAGVRIPTSAADAWTVVEFDSILKDLQAYGYPTPLNIEWGDDAGELRSFAFGPVLLSAGTGMLSADGRTSDGALNSPQAAWALNWFREWSSQGLVDLDTDPGGNDRNFIAGRSAISWAGHWAGDAYRKALGDNLILVPLPNFGKGSKVFTGSWSFALSARSAHPQAAWALIDYLTNPEASKALATVESAIPAVKADLAADPLYQPGGQRYLYLQDLNDSAVAQPRPASPAYLAARDQFSLAFGNIIQGVSARSALRVASTRVQQEIRLNDGYPDQ